MEFFEVNKSLQHGVQGIGHIILHSTNDFWQVRTHTWKNSSIFWMLKMSIFTKNEIFTVRLSESMYELFVRTHILESYFSGFFRWCRTFWLLTIIPLDQNWSTYVTMKVIQNHYHFKFSHKFFWKSSKTVFQHIYFTDPKSPRDEFLFSEKFFYQKVWVLKNVLNTHHIAISSYL